MSELNADYWSSRYVENQIGWDLGQVSPPLKAYFDQLENKDLKILIPGCGRSHEGRYLWEQGFRNVHLTDYSSHALAEFKKLCPEFPESQLHCVDFFEMDGEFDLIIEQTMFCAINPELREDYVKKVHELLKTKGKIAGLLFNRDFDGGPPFGGNMIDYYGLFDVHFARIHMEECHNSIAPRQGSEVFFIAEK